MSLDQILPYAIASVTLLGPLFGFCFSIISRLAKIEERLNSEDVRVKESLERHDRHIHEIRNHLQAISLRLARKDGQDE
jgi:SHS2 domain-containing protein